MDKMKKPSLSCKIELFCPLNPSEDPSKVKFAIENILSNSKIKIDKFSIKVSSSDLQSLDKIHEEINSMKSQRIYQRTLEKNLNINSTWFYLNKQAAFANKLAICEKSDESPLGPIKLVLTSTNIDRVIDWLIQGER